MAPDQLHQRPDRLPVAVPALPSDQLLLLVRLPGTAVTVPGNCSDAPQMQGQLGSQLPQEPQQDGSAVQVSKQLPKQLPQVWSAQVGHPDAPATRAI